MAYEKQIEDFSEAKAIWLSHSDLPLLNTEQLTRGWKAVTDANKAANEAYLNLYVSAKNASPSSTVTDPQADGSGTNPDGSLKNVHTGLWRHVSTSWSVEQNMYVQVLRKGWASGLDPWAATGVDACRECAHSSNDVGGLPAGWRGTAVGKDSEADMGMVRLPRTSQMYPADGVCGSGTARLRGGVPIATPPIFVAALPGWPRAATPRPPRRPRH